MSTEITENKVNLFMDKYGFKETSQQTDNGNNITVVHNLGDMIYAAFPNWQVRHKNLTPASFCNYINEKRLRGMTDHWAFTKKQFLQISIGKTKIYGNHPFK